MRLNLQPKEDNRDEYAYAKYTQRELPKIYTERKSTFRDK